MAEARLQVIAGGAVPQEPLTTDPWQFQTACVDAFVASWRARGFSPVTTDNDIGQLERTLKALGMPAWEVTPEDIDRVIGDLAVQGRKTSTRREYVQIFKGFHRFLQARKAPEIEAAFGVRLVCPIDEFNASRHVGDDSPALLAPPTPERVNEFFDFMKRRIATARKYGPAARDYAMFRTLYHAGLRSEEASLLERPDLHFTRGPFGELHVRFGKGAHTSGPRPRLGAHARRPRPGPAMVPGRRTAQVPQLAGAVRRRVGRQPASWDHPQPAPLSDGTRRPPGDRPLQPACPATGVRDPQL